MQPLAPDAAPEAPQYLKDASHRMVVHQWWSTCAGLIALILRWHSCTPSPSADRDGFTGLHQYEPPRVPLPLERSRIGPRRGDPNLACTQRLCVIAAAMSAMDTRLDMSLDDVIKQNAKQTAGRGAAKGAKNNSNKVVQPLPIAARARTRTLLASMHAHAASKFDLSCASLLDLQLPCLRICVRQPAERLVAG